MVVRRLLAAVLLLAAGWSIVSASDKGRFTGELVVRMDDGGRKATLMQPFGYVDPEGRQWDVPANTIVDGASIPRALWSIVGSPWTGLYRKASVVHDYYCDTKDRGWRNVHKVFYDAMITEGMGIAEAKLMYGAVLYFGPKWKKELGLDGKVQLSTWQPQFDEAKFNQLRNWINTQNPSLDQIDALVQ
jgi:hypothetical protein